MRINRFFIWRNMNPYHPRMLVPRLVEIGSVVLEKRIFNFVIVFSIFRNYLPLEKGGARHLNKLEPFTQGCFVPSLVEIGPVVLEKTLILSMYFRYFVIISPWKRAGPFIWTNLNPLHPRMLCAKFGWNWPSGSGEEDFLISSMYFSLFRYYLPLEKGRALHLNKLESPSPKNALCLVWLKLAQWFWRRRFF